MRLRHVVLIVVMLLGLAGWLGLEWLASDISDQPYTQIEANLYVGALVKAPPPATYAVLNLCQQQDCYQATVHRDEPIDGSAAPDIDWLWRNVKFIDEHRRAGRTVYVHCFAGMNRSGM